LAGFSYKPDLDICKFVQFAVFGVCNFWAIYVTPFGPLLIDKASISKPRG
jgi:hypothetical protein